jgi:hypothetical protein
MFANCASSLKRVLCGNCRTPVHEINKTDTTDVGLVVAEFMIYDSRFELPWLGQSGNLRVLNGNNVILQAGQSYGTGTAQGGTTTSIALASTASVSDPPNPACSGRHFAG